MCRRFFYAINWAEPCCKNLGNFLSIRYTVSTDYLRLSATSSLFNYCPKFFSSVWGEVILHVLITYLLLLLLASLVEPPIYIAVPWTYKISRFSEKFLFLLSSFRILEPFSPDKKIFTWNSIFNPPVFIPAGYTLLSSWITMWCHFGNCLFHAI